MSRVLDPLAAVSEERPDTADPEDGGHYTDGRPCWCQPEIEEVEGGGRLIIHRGPEDWS